MEITVNNSKWVLHENDAVLVFPNQIHSLKTIDYSSHILCIFSKKLVNYFTKSTQPFLPRSNFFKLSPQYIDLLLQICDSHSVNKAKGVLYLICDKFNSSAEYVKKTGDIKDDLISKIFEFVDNNYKDECTLKELEKHMQYSYVYLSRYFKQHCGITFNDYVNHCRIGEACRLLQTTDKSILSISSECGYYSLRSFNRNFKEIVGISPKQYLSSNSKS